MDELLPYLCLVCYAEGYQVDPADLIGLISLIGCDIRQLLHLLELYRGVPHPFQTYLGNCNPPYDVFSKTAVDSDRLTRCYQSAIRHEEDSEMKDQDSLENILANLENEAFMDAWLEPKDHRLLVNSPY